MKKNIVAKFVLILIAMQVAFAHAQDDDLPFDDLDMESTPSAPVKKKVTTTKKAPPEAKQQKAAAVEEKAEVDPLDELDDALASSEVENEKPATAKVESLDDETLPADDLGLDDELIAESEIKKEEGVRDLLTPDPSISQAKSVKVPPPIPAPLRDTEVASTLDPSEQFDRIPLKPQMSDANWRKYAGPALDKSIRIRKRDTLWGISERMFGNPYLWPKVWQLNAQFGNPHMIDPGIELLFYLGNPNSAPNLAVKFKDGKPEFLPVFESFQKLSFLDELERIMRHQTESSDPPFQQFLVEELPEEIGKMPKRQNDKTIFYTEGDRFEIDLEDGEYSIIRSSTLGRKGSIKAPFNGYRVHWIGSLVVKERRGIISRAFTEIERGTTIISKDYSFQPLALREESINEEELAKMRLVPIEEGTMAAGAGTNRMIGIRFPKKESGVSPGAILKLRDGINPLATMVMVHREGRFGTAWVYEAHREILPNDQFW